MDPPGHRRPVGIARREVLQEGEGAAERGFRRRRPIRAMTVALVEQLDGRIVQRRGWLHLNLAAAAPGTPVAVSFSHRTILTP